jgi:uncharacterized membrane protein
LPGTAEQERQLGTSRIASPMPSLASPVRCRSYLHIIWFTLWIALGVEKFPFGSLTMLVSLEAIFLSTFVMISQNRADEKRAALAEHQWQIVQSEEKQNEELLTLSRQILDLTKQIHSLTRGSKEGSTETGAPSSGA